VGHKEEPRSPVREAGFARLDDASFDVVSERGEAVRNAIQSPRDKRGDVLDDDDSRPELGRDPLEVVPESGAIAFEAASVRVRDGEILAGEAPAHDVDGSES
jgi:hypothetical protein